MRARFYRAIAQALACLALVASLSPASAQEPRRSTPADPLHTYLSNDDYPAEAIKRQEQGTVAFRVAVGADGRPTGCTIVSSSGSTVLDATSCRIVVERARFTPATDASGKPVPDTFDGKITWRLPSEGGTHVLNIPPAVNVATDLWFTCIHGETAKLVLSPLLAPQVAERAFAACTPLEERMAAEMIKAQVDGLNPSHAIPAVKDGAVGAISEVLARSREALNGEAGK